jgi:hypothetical protein
MSNANKWITDRLPTEADGDMDGDVRMVPAPHADPDDYLLVHWSYVGDAAPWQRTDCWKPPTEPTPTESDRIAALERRVAGLEAFKKALMQPSVSYSLGN